MPSWPLETLDCDSDFLSVLLRPFRNVGPAEDSLSPSKRCRIRCIEFSETPIKFASYEIVVAVVGVKNSRLECCQVCLVARYLGTGIK